jgi:hypothetical protein
MLGTYMKLSHSEISNCVVIIDVNLKKKKNYSDTFQNVL